MANHTQIYREKKKLTLKEVRKVIDDINKEMFNNLLTIEEGDNNYICIQRSTIIHGGLEMWFEDEDYDIYPKGEPIKVANSYLDVRQGHGLTFYWWLDHLFLCEIANRVNGICVGEGFQNPSDIKKGHVYTYNSKNFKDALKVHYSFMRTSLVKKLLSNQMYKSEMKRTKEYIDNDAVFNHCLKM